MEGNFRVGPWLVEPSLNTVSRNGTSVRLEPKQMEVLVCLAEHAAAPVSKERLLKAAWPDTFVGDDVLIRSIFALRRAFEDDPKNPRFIQTVPKRGYRLVAQVLRVNDNEAGTDSGWQTSEPSRATVFWDRRKLWYGGVGLANAALLFALLFVSNVGGLRTRLRPDKTPPIRSLAVLPLQNLSDDANQEYLADGMTDELITELSGISPLKVISRTSIMRYKKTSKSLPEIARELSVEGIVEGSVLRSGDDVRVTLQLVYAVQDTNVWAYSYERHVSDVFALDRDVAQAIARQVQTRLAPPQNQTGRTQLRPVNVKALEAYLQGRHHLDQVGRGSGDTEARQAADYFQQAIQDDPDFVQAYSGLAEAHNHRLLPLSEDADIVREAQEKVVALAPDSVEAALCLADAKARQWDWAGADEVYRKVIALNPNSVDAHRAYARFLDDLGRLDEGWKELQAAQQLDPNPELLAPDLDLPEALMRRGAYDKAMVLLLRIDDSQTHDGQTHLDLSECYAQKGMYKEAIEELGRTSTLYGYSEIETRLRRAFRASGYRGALRQWAQEIEHLQTAKEVYFPSYLATIYAKLGDTDRTFYWLEESYKFPNRSGQGNDLVGFLKTAPALQTLRADPRYFDLLRRMRLPR